jgi:hypothetical protein
LANIKRVWFDFAEKTDGNEADRTAEGFAKLFGTCFPPEFSITEGNAWMAASNNSIQYVSALRPGYDVPDAGQADALPYFCGDVPYGLV